MRIVAGFLLGLIVSECLIIGTQLAVWGSNAPDWYLVPCVLVGMTGGIMGTTFGFAWDERAPEGR